MFDRIFAGNEKFIYERRFVHFKGDEKFGDYSQYYNLISDENSLDSALIAGIVFAIVIPLILSVLFLRRFQNKN